MNYFLLSFEDFGSLGSTLNLDWNPLDTCDYDKLDTT